MRKIYRADDMPRGQYAAEDDIPRGRYAAKNFSYWRLFQSSLKNIALRKFHFQHYSFKNVNRKCKIYYYNLTEYIIIIYY